MRKEAVMAKYMIHTYPKRLWYVEEFLVPSMIEQGVNGANITVWNDEYQVGNLESCLQSFDSVPDDDYGTWHLQDDVVISSKFKELTDKFDEGIVCGFCNTIFDSCFANMVGIVPIFSGWFSFQCIRIPNRYAKEFVRWYRKIVVPANLLEDLRKDGKNDDAIWRNFIRSSHPQMQCHNLSPNIVDHIDYLIGGSAINSSREGTRKSYHFNEPDKIEELKEKLARRNADGFSEPR